MLASIGSGFALLLSSCSFFAGGIAPGSFDSSTGGTIFHVEGMRLAAVHRQSVELRVLAAMGEEQDAVAVGHPLAGGLAALFAAEE